jgi:amino acid permease
MSENNTPTKNNQSQPTNIDPMDESHFNFNPEQTTPSLNINQTNSQNNESSNQNNSQNNNNDNNNNLNPSQSNSDNNSDNTKKISDTTSNSKSNNIDISSGGANVEIVRDQREAEQNKNKAKMKKPTILSSAFMITNICLGTTIFTFATMAKSFGLFWLLFFCLVIALANYWAIMNCVYASSRSKYDDYSEICQEALGRKWRIVLNVIIIVYSYATLMSFLALIFPLFGRFVQSAFYRNDYTDFDAFKKAKWGKAYIKYPFFLGVAFILSLMCLIKDINKLNFTSYIGVFACGYAIVIVMFQCGSYYKHYKDTVYKEDDDSTHANWFNLGRAFTKDLIFFKGIANLIFAYACQVGIFPIYAGFKTQEGKGVKKMRMGAMFGMIFTTVLHVVSMVCSFLTDPITPEDLIIYRKNKGTGKDVFMIIARLSVSISLIFTVPGNYFPLRLSFINAFTGGKLTNLFNVLFTFISIFACALIASVYDKILNYLSYIGFISVFISYLYPAILCIATSGKKVTYWKNLFDLILAIIICITGLIAFIATFKSDIKG